MRKAIVLFVAAATLSIAVALTLGTGLAKASNGVCNSGPNESGIERTGPAFFTSESFDLTVGNKMEVNAGDIVRGRWDVFGRNGDELQVGIRQQGLNDPQAYIEYNGNFEDIHSIAIGNVYHVRITNNGNGSGDVTYTAEIWNSNWHLGETNTISAGAFDVEAEGMAPPTAPNLCDEESFFFDSITPRYTSGQEFWVWDTCPYSEYTPAYNVGVSFMIATGYTFC